MVDILLIDDEKNFRQSLAEGLRMYSKRLNVIAVNSGEKALEILRTAMIDIIVTDLNMHGMDGFELLKRLQQTHPRIPVIIMSAYSQMSVDDQLKNLRYAEYIEKPLDLSAIANAILTLSQIPSFDTSTANHYAT